MIPVTVSEMSNAPYPGMYMATRKSDGWMWCKVNYGGRSTRKWFKPEMVRFKEEIEGREVYVDKQTELR
jgi:hypothetical protein